MLPFDGRTGFTFSKRQLRDNIVTFPVNNIQSISNLNIIENAFTVGNSKKVNFLFEATVSTI